MKVTTLESNGPKIIFSLTGKCPHCLHDTVCIMVTAPYEEQINGGPPNLSAAKRFAAVTQCQGCRKYVLGVVTRPAVLPGHTPTGPLEYQAHYPVGSPDDTVAAEIPGQIRDNFQEALRCLFVSAYNATAEMCRRAIEGSCIQAGVPSDKKSFEQKIDWMAEKQKITPFLAEVAHKIRLGGNRAAHFPEQANLQEPEEQPISAEQAEAIVKFTREYFHHLYVVPSELAKYDFSKPKKAASAPST